MTQPNPSTAQARAIADELHRQGVDYAVVSPGSRSAALALALDGHPGIETRVILDERSAAFHALGRARVTSAPVVALCTSGTALANYLPAVVEADLSMLPLILVSADRPPDLLHVGANQTIDQVRIFGDKTRWFCNLPPAEPARDWNRYWRTSVSQLAARALGHGGRPGPVHLNVAFREPTVPVSDDGRSMAEPYPHSIEGRAAGGPWQRHERSRPGAGSMPVSGERGLLVVGEGDFEPAELKRAADRLRWPVLATATSGLRSFEVTTAYHHLLVEGVPVSLRPDFVVTVGRTGPSDRIGAITALDVPQIQIDRWGSWNDPRRHSTVLLQADPAPTLDRVEGASVEEFAATWADANAAMRAALDERLAQDESPTGPSVARALGDLEFDVLIAASSMPVRDVDAHTVHEARTISNRGASGIDGLVSTALGVASAGRRTVALAGDLSLLHDVGGFVVDAPGNIVFVVIDNGGGGLFDLLPQADHAPGFDRLFVTPHGLDLERVVAAYGIGSSTVQVVGDLGPSIATLIQTGGAHVVVVPVERETDLKQRRALDDAARLVCAGLS